MKSYLCYSVNRPLGPDSRWLDIIQIWKVQLQKIYVYNIFTLFFTDGNMLGLKSRRVEFTAPQNLLIPPLRGNTFTHATHAHTDSCRLIMVAYVCRHTWISTHSLSVISYGVPVLAVARNYSQDATYLHMWIILHNNTSLESFIMPQVASVCLCLSHSLCLSHMHSNNNIKQLLKSRSRQRQLGFTLWMLRHTQR